MVRAFAEEEDYVRAGRRAKFGLLEAAELGERGRVPHGAGLNMAVGSENKCMHGQRLACMVLVRGTGAACLPRLPCCTFDCGSGCGGWGMQRGQSDGARGETGPAWGGWLQVPACCD